MTGCMHVSAAARGLNTTGDPWMSLAACRNMQWTFDQACDALESNSERRRRTPAVQAAKTVCKDCPVLGSCREWALTLTDTEDQHGILGGWVPQERRTMRRRGRP